MARRIAVDLVNKFNLKSCMVQLGYAIGLANPVSVIAEADGKTDFNRYIKENYDLTPKGIINHLGLYKHKLRDTVGGLSLQIRRSDNSGRWNAGNKP